MRQPRKGRRRRPRRKRRKGGGYAPQSERLLRLGVPGANRAGEMLQTAAEARASSFPNSTIGTATRKGIRARGAKLETEQSLRPSFSAAGDRPSRCWKGGGVKDSLAGRGGASEQQAFTPRNEAHADSDEPGHPARRPDPRAGRRRFNGLHWAPMSGRRVAGSAPRSPGAARCGDFSR